MDSAILLPKLLAAAWLIPLASFTLIVLFGPRLGHAGRLAGVLATGAILTSALLSQFALWAVWLPQHQWGRPGMGESPAAGDHSQLVPGAVARVRLVRAAGEEKAADAHAGAEHAASSAAPGHEAAPGGAAHDEHGAHAPPKVYPPSYYSGDWYTLGQFGRLRVTIGYYIDALTVLMFAMVTFIATCIHFYANGYMHDELHEVVDHEVTVHGHHLHRPGRFHRFFQYLSLFCFSMLGIVIAGNIAMVFVFWELVGICSYFLIGFYIERQSASTAANKAFIVNRVGDFGMIIGLMALFGSLGTFAFGDWQDSEGKLQPGLFSLVRPAANHWKLTVPDGMLAAAGSHEVGRIIHEHMTTGAIDAAGADAATPAAELAAEQKAAGLAAGKSEVAARLGEWREDWREDSDEGSYGRQAYWLLVIAGLGIFCGCVGKSAQFPLHVWLPDAMEGPTPVSALVHSATMVAAGVYLVGRFYPVFAPEVLLAIAVIGCITLFLAATIAITATDIKRVLAYSTISQLGYMMLALGAGGWVAGLFHLITHAFFKSLLFMCSGSVIHAVHTNEMPLMGGLRHKMPWTAYTMLIGCLAIAGAGIPFVIGFSGYYSKDSIIAQTLAFRDANPAWGFPFYAASISAAITSFYMFRLWYMTFAGKPRDHHKYEHAHESPKVMVYPLAVLAALAIGVGWQIPFSPIGVENLLEQARPAGTGQGEIGALLTDLRYPSEFSAHHFHPLATVVASTMALTGFVLATLFYGLKVLDPADVQRQFVPIYRLLHNKWYFDELYNAIFVQPCHFVARRVADFDKNVIDEFIHFLARSAVWISRLDDLIDRYIVDGIVNWFARWTYAVALGLKVAQTGQLRQYILFIVVGTVGLFVLISYALAGP